MTRDFYNWIETSVEEMLSMGFSIKTIAKRYNINEDKLRSYLNKKRAIRDQHQAIVDARIEAEKNKSRKNK